MESGVADVATPVRSLPANDQLPEGFAAPGDNTIPADLPEPVVETKVVEPSRVDAPTEPSEDVSEGSSDPPKEVLEGAGDMGLSAPSSVSCSINIIVLVLNFYCSPSHPYIYIYIYHLWWLKATTSPFSNLMPSKCLISNVGNYP